MVGTMDRCDKNLALIIDFSSYKIYYNIIYFLINFKIMHNLIKIWKKQAKFKNM